jgi:hypothetical protein
MAIQVPKMVATTEYRVVLSREYHKFVGLVNDALAEGWVCQGGVTTDSDDDYLFLQAMIRIVVRTE